MKRPLRAILLVLVAALVAPVLVTGGATGATPTKLTIGVANYTLAAPYFVGMSKAVQSEAAAYKNVDVLVTDANGDAAKFTSNIQDLLTKHPTGLILSAGPLEAAPAALAAIEKAGVPVVMVDRLLKGGAYTSWVGPDNFTIGKQDGSYIAKQAAWQRNTADHPRRPGRQLDRPRPHERRPVGREQLQGHQGHQGPCVR